MSLYPARYTPAFSPDGEKVLYGVLADGGSGLYVSNSNGEGTPQKLVLSGSDAGWGPALVRKEP